MFKFEFSRMSNGCEYFMVSINRVTHQRSDRKFNREDDNQSIMKVDTKGNYELLIPDVTDFIEDLMYQSFEAYYKQYKKQEMLSE